VNLVAFGLAIWAFVANLDALAAPLERALDPGEPSAWWGWAWAGPLLLLALLARWLLLAALGVAIYFLFTILGGIVAAPFLEVLSERVERIVAGERARADAGLADLLRSASRSVVEEGKRTLFFVSSSSRSCCSVSFRAAADRGKPRASCSPRSSCRSTTTPTR
jgi:CysZ protein